MPKKCAPGVICIENVTMVFILLLILIVGFLYYQNMRSQNKATKTSAAETSVEKVIVQPQLAFQRQLSVPQQMYLMIRTRLL